MSVLKYSKDILRNSVKDIEASIKYSQGEIFKGSEKYRYHNYKIVSLPRSSKRHRITSFFSSYEMKERLINLLNMIRKQLKSEPKMSRFKFVVNGFICEDTGQDIKLWSLYKHVNEAL